MQPWAGALIAVNDRGDGAREHPVQPRRHPGTAARARARVRAIARALVPALALALAAAIGPVHAAPGAGPAAFDAQGRVVRVLDGDSVLMRVAAGGLRGIRIAGIDAPEKGQPHADASRRALLALLHEREVRVEVVKTDRFDRWVARVFVENRDAGLAQLRAGLAWHFTRYDADLAPAVRRRYARAERQARLRAIGLWRDPAPEPPWEHRAKARAAPGASTLVPGVAAALR
ncbi:MAG TPA: thermonuclease family protein [Zeimonas sp.]|nr:thermonuclease family protein [Zeimonas sp.]